jgi:hypothetical protein
VGELLGDPVPLDVASPEEVERDVEALRRFEATILKKAQRLQDDLARLQRAGTMAELEELLIEAATGNEGLQIMLQREWGDTPGERYHPRVIEARNRVYDAMNFDLGSVVGDIIEEYKEMPSEGRVIDIDTRRNIA